MNSFVPVQLNKPVIEWFILSFDNIETAVLVKEERWGNSLIIGNSSPACPSAKSDKCYCDF